MARTDLYAFIVRLSTLPVVVVFTLLAASLLWSIQVQGLPIIPGFHAVLRIGLPDMMLTYAPSTIHQKLTLFGPDGRVAYRHFLEWVDSLFPAIYGIFYVTSTTFLFVRLFPNRPALQKLSLLPLLTSLFDWAENVCFLLFLRSYPQELPNLEKLANAFTLIKWFFAILSSVVLLIAVLALLFRARRPPSTAPAA